MLTLLDSGFLALWLTGLMGVIIGLGFVWGSTDVSEQNDRKRHTDTPQAPPDGSNRSSPSIVPLLPLLLVLLLPPLILPPLFLFSLRKTVRPVLLATAITIPGSLFVCGWWALGASFETSGLDKVEQSDRWWGTTGLRLCAVLLWTVAALFGRLVWLRRRRLERTAAVVEVNSLPMRIAS